MYSQKNEKELETLIQTIRIYNQDIAMEFSIKKYAIIIKKIEKRETSEKIELSNQKIIRHALRKGKLHVLENIGSGHYQTKRGGVKNKKRVAQTNKKVSQNHTLQKKSH